MNNELSVSEAATYGLTQQQTLVYRRAASWLQRGASLAEALRNGIEGARLENDYRKNLQALAQLVKVSVPAEEQK